MCVWSWELVRLLSSLRGSISTRGWGSLCPDTQQGMCLYYPDLVQQGRTPITLMNNRNQGETWQNGGVIWNQENTFGTGLEGRQENEMNVRKIMKVNWKQRERRQSDQIRMRRCALHQCVRRSLVRHLSAPTWMGSMMMSICFHYSDCRFL